MILASLKTFWAANTTLTAALPISKVYLDLVPSSTAFPYARLSVLGKTPEYLTGGNHIEAFTYQLSFFNTDFDALATMVDTIQTVLDQSYPTAATMIHRRTNNLMTNEVVNGVYTYGLHLQYSWTYYTSSS